MKFILRILLLLAIAPVFIQKVYAQENKPVPLRNIPTGKDKVVPKDTVITSEKGVPQQDVSDALRRLFHLKPALVNDTIGTKPQLSVVPAIGYTLVSRLAIVLSGNVAFRTAPQSRISTIVASTDYTQNKQFTVPIQTSIWTKDNEYNFIGDYRFYKYPQSTYGLGSSASIKNDDPMDYSFFQFYETAQRHVAGNWYTGIGYLFDDHWNISHQGPKNNAPSDYAAYHPREHTISTGPTITALYDSRDNSINPSKGWFGNFQFRTSFKSFGSTYDWQSMIIDIRKYVRFPAGSANVLAFWTYEWLVLGGKAPYLDLPSTSWDPNSATGRGYIQGRYRGAQMIYGEVEYRYRLTSDGLLGGVFFMNAQSLSARQHTNLQTVQPAFGPGLRVKLNKVSKTNIAIDYGFGSQGSRGLFIDVGEIF